MVQGLGFGARSAKVRTRMMTSRPTKMNDPITATYSVLGQDVRGLNGDAGCGRWCLHGEAPEERDRHCLRRKLRFDGAICWLVAQIPWDGCCVWYLGISKGATLCDGRRMRGATRRVA